MTSEIDDEEKDKVVLERDEVAEVWSPGFLTAATVGVIAIAAFAFSFIIGRRH
jgi:hypothetical protein